MDAFTTEQKQDWDTFKSELSRDMDELGKSLKDFNVKNVK
jgi:hypothetical protein